MPSVVIYLTRFCPYCRWAKKLLNEKGVVYEEIELDHQPERWGEMERRSGRATVPQIFIGELHIGGFDDLHALDQAGKLDPLLHP